jgi:methyltransferase-like protein/SAM-dependent methyltransferase
MSSSSPSSYDLIPYPNYCFPQTHPDRAAAIATLLELQPPPVARCRVLELGCAAGSNLIPMAEELTDSTFLGIDLSQRQINDGKKAIAELGLTNIELRQQSILEFEPESETFDYIICHGVFSWVPPGVQDRILTLAQRCLQPNGIAYVSYNTLPGWHMRGMIRDMMLYHGRRFSDPKQQVSQARGLLDFLVASIPMAENPYGQFLRSELESLRQAPDSYLFHDHLEENNNPLYFHQFIERASSHGLRYLADADVCMMNPQNLAPQVAQALGRVSNDLIQMEQYMDFLRNRTFRQTLLCRASHTPSYTTDPKVLTPFFISSPLLPASPHANLNPSVREDFRRPTGSTAFSLYPIVKAALLVLGEAWPRTYSLLELFCAARAKLDNEGIKDVVTAAEQEQQLRTALLKYYTISQDLVDFRLRPLAVTTQSGPQPLARPLARWQASSGRPVTNLRHEFVAVEAFGRQVLQRLDGQHTRAAVVQELAAQVSNGQLTIQQSVEIVSQPQRVGQALLESVEKQLDHFGRSALLLA